ncbi:protein kinase domain-containing protein [Lentisalinibacter orientalis]|uniref:protein kinase domain-containing protein n=1 Tax=Lentisalinibacter orientalis TaxID=2992241 RepID=UPI0038699D25
MQDDDRFRTGGAIRDLGELAESGADSLVGSTIGPYRLLSLIAAGGMGRVYRAERTDGTFEREVAVKVVPSGLGGEYARRFELERRILASLAHPDIAQLFDAGVSESGNLYIIMELVEGEPIDRYVRDRRASTRGKARLMLRLAQVLEFAHARLVVHRDLKPSNVLITEDGSLKLLDFGIAKILESPDDLTAAYRPMTPRYASPEQLLNEPVSVASDIYQFGLLFLDLFEQQPGFEEETPASATARAVRGIPVTAESRLLGRLPTELAAIINKCLRPDPAERYGSAADLARDLENHLAGYPVAARNPGVLQRGGKFLRRNWLPSATVALFLAVTVASTAWYIHAIDRERAAAILANERAQQEAAVAESMSDFLLGMISGSNAMLTPDEPRTVPEAVTRGAELLQTELAERPVVRARLVNSLSGALNSMAEWQSSRDLLEAALPELIDHPDIDFEQRGLLRSNLAYATYRLSDFDAAREPYGEIIDLYERAGRADDLVYANAWRRLGLLERRAANFDAAVENMERAERAYRAADAPVGVLGGFAGDYGLVLSHQDKAAAIAKYEESIRLLRQIQGDDCTRCAITMVNMAWALREQERLDEALETIEEADRIYRQNLGDNYGTRQGSIVFEKAAIMNDMGRYEEADRLHRQATGIYHRELGARHSLYALSLYNHAQTHRDHGRCDLALPLLREAREIHVELFGEAGEWVKKDDARIAQCEQRLQD